MIYSRRDVLKTILLASGVSLMPLWREAWAAQVPPNALNGSGQNRLVVIFLRGAVDGLSLVLPYREQAYYGLRPTIAIPPPEQEGGAINLDNYFGLNPSLAAIMPMWQAGQLAFVHASGSPDPSRSHFDAQAYMETGTPGSAGSEGWMNRVLQAIPGPHGPTQGVSFGATLPLIMQGSVAVETMAEGKDNKPSVLDRPMIAQAFDRMYANSNDVLGQSYVEGQQARREIAADLGEEEIAANNGAPVAGNGFSRNAAQLARLMNRDGSVQLAFMALGGWDTHVGQGGAKGKLANLLKPLGDGLATLARQLGPIWANTVVMVVSEFGRTAKENGGGGTDHGHGNVMWLMGGAVNGGRIYGEWPGVDPAHLHEGRDLAVTTDFRSAISVVLERHLRLPDASLSSIFPQAPRVPGGLTGIVRA